MLYPYWILHWLTPRYTSSSSKVKFVEQLFNSHSKLNWAGTFWTELHASSRSLKQLYSLSCSLETKVYVKNMYQSSSNIKKSLKNTSSWLWKTFCKNLKNTIFNGAKYKVKLLYLKLEMLLSSLTFMNRLKWNLVCNFHLLILV